jgi:DNA polymerase-3 subunit alpha
MRGVHVFAPDINISEANYMLYRDGIIPGIGSIKGFDKIAGQIVAERAENGEYTSIYNIIDRCPFLDSKDIDTLVRSGACDPLLASFAGNRDTASENAKLYKSTIGELADAEDKLAEWKAKPSETEKDAKANAKGTKTYTDRIAEISKRLDMIRQTKNQTPMSTVKRLAYESELLGLWVTGNPLDDYNLDNGKYNLVEDIESMEERTRVTVAGFITDVKKIYTKKDGHAMCVFTLVDQNGSRIRGIAFPSAYDSCGKDIKNNSVIELKGQVTLDNRTKDGEDPERQISVNAIAPLVENRQLLIVDARSMEEMADVIRPLLDRCSTKSGTQVKIHERSTNTMFLYQLAVDAERCGQMLQQSRLSYAFA